MVPHHVHLNHSPPLLLSRPCSLPLTLTLLFSLVPPPPPFFSHSVLHLCFLPRKVPPEYTAVAPPLRGRRRPAEAFRSGATSSRPSPPKESRRAPVRATSPSSSSPRPATPAAGICRLRATTSTDDSLSPLPVSPSSDSSLFPLFLVLYTMRPSSTYSGRHGNRSRAPSIGFSSLILAPGTHTHELRSP